MCEQRFRELQERLLEWGYRRGPVEDAIQKVRVLARDDILDRVERDDKSMNRVRAVFKYDRRLPNISAILFKNWKTMVEDDRRLKEVFPEPPMACFRRGKNIQEEVCRAMLPPARMGRQLEDGFRRCGRPSCRLCPYTNIKQGTVLKTVRISSTGEDMAIKGNITCTTSSTLGPVGRGTGPVQTIHSTVGKLARLLRRGLLAIGTPLSRAAMRTPTSLWGSTSGSLGSVADLIFTPIERIYSRNVFVRKAREKLLISKLNLKSA